MTMVTVPVLKFVVEGYRYLSDVPRSRDELFELAVKVRFAQAQAVAEKDDDARQETDSFEDHDDYQNRNKSCWIRSELDEWPLHVLDRLADDISDARNKALIEAWNGLEDELLGVLIKYGFNEGHLMRKYRGEFDPRDEPFYDTHFYDDTHSMSAQEKYALQNAA